MMTDMKEDNKCKEICLLMIKKMIFDFFVKIVHKLFYTLKYK
jgi:hypothetical protein